MRVKRSAVCVNVDDVEASASFLARHLGFEREMSADGFASMTRTDAGFNIVLPRVGLETLKPEYLKERKADGVLVVFEVEDIDSEFERLRSEGVEILTPLETEEWGERYFQVIDPNGLIVQLVEWIHR